MSLPRRERLASAAVAILVQAALVALLAQGWSRRTEPPAQRITAVEIMLPPPPPVAPPPHLAAPRAARTAAPPARKAEATPIVAPPPVVPLVLPPPPVVAAPVPMAGAAASAGAATAGPGTGAGGEGEGTGGGGTGGLGDGETPPRWHHGKLKGSDYPAAAAARGATGTVSVIFTVEPDGRVDRCTITHSSGDPDLDAATCRLIEKRYRFEPARDADGRPIPLRVGEDHSWAIARDEAQANAD